MKLLTALVAALVFLPSAAFAQTTIVSFTFDDAPKTVFEVGFPILKHYQFPATLYVSTRNTEYDDYMNWDQIAAVAQEGWEIGAHTHTHPHLTKLSDAEVLDDLLTSTQEFAKHGYAPVNFASPFGDMDDRVLSIISRHYASHRTAWPDGVNSIPPDPYNLVAYEVNRDTTLAEVSTVLDGLQSQGGWLVLLMHHVSSKGEAMEHEYGTNLLEDIAQLVQTKGFPVMTMGQALGQFK
jgi:peptidoglycan/xylan/chitin deacetylase (PgdA/CDA1 family)